MPPHTKIYLKHFGFKIAEDVRCEQCRRPAIDIHHITGRGKDKDVISNLIALCRQHHNDCHNEKISKNEIQQIHDEFLLIGELF